MPEFHKIRKTVHGICFLLFILLPFLDIVRFDIPRQRFYFAGRELWIDEFGIIFSALMFLMFVVVAFSVLYGRVYCGYLCPQMIFSEWSVWLEQKLRRRSKVWFYAILGVASVFLAFVFVSYFVAPGDLLGRLLSLDIRTAAGITGAAVTLLTFLDFTIVRQKFCTTVCPYGYLQAMLEDRNTLLVHYRDPEQTCIQCKKCVRVCPMGIDIRNSPHQIECIHCGECIDACTAVLARLKRPTLIHYTWGTGGEKLGDPAPWWRRIGFRDPRRVVVGLVVLFYAAGLATALAMRRDVLVRIAPVRTTLYTIDAAGRVANHFRITVANRGKHRAEVPLSAEGLPGAEVHYRAAVAPGETARGEFDVSAPAGDEVRHFVIVAGGEKFPMTFLGPGKR